MNMSVQTVVAFRHGQSLQNLANRYAYRGEWEEYRRIRAMYDDPYHCPLTEKGLAQAAALGPYLKQIVGARFLPTGQVGICSPQLRARQTATATNLHEEWLEDCRICERSKGDLETQIMTAETYPAFKAESAACVANPYRKPPNGHSVAERFRDFRGFINERHRQNREMLVLSTHGEMQRIIALVLEGKSLKLWSRYQFEVRNCFLLAYTRVDPETGEVSDTFDWRLSFCCADGEPDLTWSRLTR
jgi:broad specificity phosphatase PhoE